MNRLELSHSEPPTAGTSSETANPARKRLLRQVMAAAAGVLITGTAIVVAATFGPAWRAGRALSSPEAATRGDALTEVANERYQWLADDVLSLLEQETDRELLDKAGYAALRLRDRRAIEILRRRADAGPDDVTRARLVTYAARLSNRDQILLPWLQSYAASQEAWRSAGGAVGLLELGRSEAGPLLIAQARSAGPELRSFAVFELQRIFEPMMQTVGQPMDWRRLEQSLPADPRWTALATFWERYASDRLLADVLDRVEGFDPDWQMLIRVQHAREHAEELLY
ncbi:MAG: hypothetical protein AMXMBFR13_27480 [Phycisphaerae bacterium]